MGIRTPRTAALVIVSVCVLFFGSAGADPVSYFETFFSSTYQDVSATTADWNQGAGHIALPDVQLVLGTGYDTPGAAVGIDSDGKYVYVADWTSGLEIFDGRTTPPTLIGSYNTAGEAHAVAVDGNYAYIADGDLGLQIVDVSVPTSPTLAGSLALTGRTYDVVVHGDYVIATHWRSTPFALNYITVIDVSDPTSPASAGSLTMPSLAWRLFADGDNIYVADGASGLRIVSVATPTSPTIIGSYDTAGNARDVCVDGNIAYVADESGGLVVLNVTNPASPSLLTTTATAGSAVGVRVDGNYVYVADAANGVVEFYVRNPSAPLLLATENTPGSASDIVIELPTIFVADNTGGLVVINAGYGPTILTDTVAEVGSMPTSGTANDIAIAGDVAFIADGADGIVAVDISVPESPWILGTFNTSGIARSVDVQADHLYVADGAAGLVVLNVSNPSSPSLLGSYNTPSDATKVRVAGDYAYVADGTSLQVIDISTPSSPALAASVAIAAWGVDVEGNHAYVAGGSAGLRVIDITDPTTPSVIATEAAFFAVDVDVTGDDCFVATGSLLWLDVSNPANPSVVTSMFSAQDLARVVVAGDYVFAANRYASSVLDMGVLVFERTSGSLVEVDFFGTDSDPGAVAVAGDHIFATIKPYAFSTSDGLQVVRFFNRVVDQGGDIGQSTEVVYYCGSDDVVAARVTPTQTGTIDWSVNTGGTTWHDMSPGVWQPLWPPGCSLKWQSQHVYLHDGVNPTCTNLVIDMLLDIPTIDAITDVPADQGGSLQLDWTRSGYDIAGSGLPITEYVIYRRSLAAPATWDSVGVAAATQSQQYSATVPTEADFSSFTGPNYTAFFIRAKLSNPSSWFDAPVDSAYSVDNIAPPPPQGFMAAYGFSGGAYNYLSWDVPLEPDVFRFYIYRSTDSEFIPGPATLVDSTTIPTVEWKDPDYHSAGVYYRVAAVDSAGNEGTPASPESVSGTGDTPEIVRFALSQNTPNPFNPATRIEYSLARPGFVVLRVYDPAGRVVRTLVNEQATAGRHVVGWDGRDNFGGQVVSGVYFYRIEAGDMVQTRKMLLLK